LLTGLLQDAEGHRFTPSHTLKNGKRYRYYVCRATIRHSDRQGKPARLPAHDIERQVSLRLQSFFRTTRDVLDELSLPEDCPALTAQLVSAAMKRSDEWSSASPAELQVFLRKVVRRVVVHTDRVETQVSKRELRAVLIDGHLASSGRTQFGQKEESSGDLIRLEVEARLKRCGGEMRLLLPPDPRGEVRSHLVTPLLKAVARAHDWYGWILGGKALNQRAISKKIGLNERYVGRVLECAFLAPDIVVAILEGCQPPDLTFEKLTRHVPLNWIEQRQRLGFPPLSQRR